MDYDQRVADFLEAARQEQREKARQVWPLAMQRLEEEVFSLEGFRRCAKEFDPEKGRFFQFLKRWVVWQALEVAEQLARENPYQIAEEIEIEECPGGLLLERPGVDICPAMLREHLEKYRQDHSDPSEQAELKLAAFELKYKAYWPLDEMTASTRQILSKRLSPKKLESLRAEYHECGIRYRNLCENLEAAFLEYRRKEEELRYWEKRLYLLGEGGLGGLERAALCQTLEHLDKTFQALSPEDRNSLKGIRLQYQMAWIRWCNAFRKLHRCRLEEEQYRNCRVPWIRSQAEVAALLGLSQATVSRYQKEICIFIQAQFC